MDPFTTQLVDTMKTELTKYPLNAAAFKGELDTVIELANSGESVNSADANGWTALHFAEFAENTEMVECLVRLGADMSLKDNMRMDPFYHAVIGEHYDIVKCLAGLGANPNTHDGRATPMHRAAGLNMTDMVKMLVELGADVNVKEQGMMAYTPLFYAGDGNKIGMVELLVNLGADLDHKDGIGMTVIGRAVNSGKFEMVKCLARLGADLNIHNVGTLTLLNLAVNRGFTDIVKLLIEQGAKLNRTDLPWPLTFRTIRNHDEATLAVLLDGGMEPDLERSLDMTPLFFSATLGNGSATNMLINAGADVNFINEHGMTPLHGSCMYGHTDVARLLLLAGSDINKTDAQGKTPLDVLPFRDLVDYSLENRWRTCQKFVESVPLSTVPDPICPPLDRLHITPGLGNVLAIPRALAKRVFTDVKEVVEKLPTLAGSMFSGARPQQVGSSGEETRTGLPNEMDFIFQVDLGLDNRAVNEVGYGYALLSYPSDAEKAFAFVKGSKSFHDIFNDMFKEFNNLSRGSKIIFMEKEMEVVKASDRKACTPMMLCWEDAGGNDRVGVSVDAVPCIHINDWPEKGTRRTWLMDHALLKKRGYNLIPKSPNVKSKIACGYSHHDLEEVWRISFSHLETEHMYSVDPRVKAVYVTAKCLRNPDVCQILIRDNGTHLKTAECYVVSYLLKMMFFQRVEEFQNTAQSLSQMVCQLFEDVEEGLSNNFIPLFFMPSINVLEGLKLDVHKCAAVARVMTRFVKALYVRDRDSVRDDVFLDRYKPDNSLFKIYDIGNIVGSIDHEEANTSIQMLYLDKAAAMTAKDSDVENIDLKPKDSSVDLLASALEQIGRLDEPGLSGTEKSYLQESSLRDVDKRRNNQSKQSYRT